MIKLKRIVKDNDFILEEINDAKVNKKLADEGEVEPVDLPHVENNPESAQDHIDAVKDIVDDENKELEKVALKTKTKDYIIEPKELKESKFFKDRSEMTPFIVKLKEQKIRHRVVPLHEDKEGYKFELKYEKPLNEQLTESYETAFEVLKDGSKVSAVGSYKSTRNYTHELVDFEWANGVGSGDYRWMNRPWERFSFAEALREAMINAGVDSKLAKDCIENSYSLKSALKYFADNCCNTKDESLKEDLLSTEDFLSWHDGDGGRHASKQTLDSIYAIFKNNGCGEDDNVDDCYDACNDDDKLKITNIIRNASESLKEELKDDDIFDILGIESSNRNKKEYKELLSQFRELAKKHDENTIWLKGDYGVACNGDIIDKTDDLIVCKESLKEDKEEPRLETFDEQMDFLAKDEQEAIDGYEKVLALVDDEHVKEQLNKILEEERAHKEFLEAVKSDKSLVYSHEDKEEEPKEDDDDNIDGFNFKDDEVVVDDDFSWDDLDNVDESLNEDKEYLSDKITTVLDDYGILYGDINDYDDRVNIVGVDESEWDEVVDAIKSELGRDVVVPDVDHEEFDDELIVYKTKKDESLKEDKDAEEYYIVTHGETGDNMYPDGFKTYAAAKKWRDAHKKDGAYGINRVLPDGTEIDESLKEDTVKKGNKWVNKGKEGTHGEFKTKKEADAQRKAMFANGYHEELEKDETISSWEDLED